VKIADFGFAKRITDLGAREVACGTPGYVAPEILRGDPYGPEVDVWSLGVIIYVLLVGYPPFYDDDQRKLFKKIKEARYYFHEDYWSGISEEAIDLIRKMLTLDQKERWTAAQLLQHPWITARDEDLAARDISGAITEMKRFNALRKFRAAGNMIMSINRMKRLGFGRRSIKGPSSSEGLSAADTILGEDTTAVANPSPPAESAPSGGTDPNTASAAVAATTTAADVAAAPSTA
jgi:serine/threonine protein kinase